MDALLLVKASLLLALALVAERGVRRAPAVVRHGLWSVGFAAVLVLPLLSAVLPALPVPIPLATFGPADAGHDTGAGSVRLFGPADAGHDTGAGSVRLQPDLDHLRLEPAPGDRGLQPHVPSRESLLLIVWALGAVAAAAALALSLARARRLARSATGMTDAGWLAAAAAIAPRAGLRRPPRLLVSPDVGTPMAGGLVRGAIFLPSTAAEWTAERRDVVLTHEIAHLARRDPLRHVVARLALACYWFHPLAWMAARRAAIAREQACDEAVLALGTRPSVYARVLLDLADSLPQPTAAVAALPIVERSRLENRLMAILTTDVRPVAARRAVVPTVGVVVLTLSVAAAQPSVSVSPAAAGIPVAPVAAPVSGEVVPAPASAVVVPADPASAFPAIQGDRGRASACWSDIDRGTFSGHTSNTLVGGRTVILEQVGWRGTDRVIQKTFGDLTLCMLAEDAGDRDRFDKPSQLIERAGRIVIEARRGNTAERLEIVRQPGQGARTSWQVAGRERTFDAAARDWRDRMFAALDTTWEISTLRGEVSSLHGEISSIHGQRSSLQGEISSLHGEISSMRGRVSSIRGEESSLRGQISSIEGHVSSLRGAISSEHGAISSLNASRYGADASDRARLATRVAQHDAEISRIERQIRDYNASARIATVEKEIAALDVEGKVAAIEKEIRAFDLEGKTAAIQKRISALDVDGRVNTIEKQITGLDAEARVRRLEDRLEDELKRLQSAIAAIR